MKKELKSKCPMCKRPLKGRYVFRCEHCNIAFATGKIVKQKESKLCVYGVDCTLKELFAKKSKHGIFCKRFKWFVNSEFCKRVCYYWTPRGYKSRPYKIYV